MRAFGPVAVSVLGVAVMGASMLSMVVQQVCCSLPMALPSSHYRGPRTHLLLMDPLAAHSAEPPAMQEAEMAEAGTVAAGGQVILHSSQL